MTQKTQFISVFPKYVTYFQYANKIIKMTTFTSTLPDNLLKALNEMSNKLSTPKNKIIEKTLQIYLNQLNRAEYIRSYKEAGNDKHLIEIAEEGMEDYLKQINQ